MNCFQYYTNIYKRHMSKKDIMASVTAAYGSEINAYAGLWGVTLPLMTVFIGFMIATGAVSGDIIKSFFKRRVGFKRGAAVPFVDQLDFILG